MEDGEDLQELVDRARGKKERRAANKLLKETDTPGRSTPASDLGVEVEFTMGHAKVRVYSIYYTLIQR